MATLLLLYPTTGILYGLAMLAVDRPWQHGESFPFTPVDFLWGMALYTALWPVLLLAHLLERRVG